jgi:hypothetical protein
MWWYCAYQARPGVSGSELAERFLRRHDAGTNRPSQVRGWFAFPSGTDGLLLYEAETPKELSAVLAPYGDLVEWTVQGLTELNYNQVLEELRRSRKARAEYDLTHGIPPARVAGVAPAQT